MANKVRGIDVVLTIKAGLLGEFYPIACARSITFTINREFIETTSYGAGYFKSYVPSVMSMTANVEGLVLLGKDTDANWNMGKLYDLLIDITGGNHFYLKFYEVDDTGVLFLQKECKAYLSAITETASFDNMTTFTADFIIDGPVTITYGEI
jgi:hypothetical protein